MTVLYESEYVVLELDTLRHIVRYTRSAIPFASVDAATDTFRTLTSTDFRVDRSKYGLLTDLRNAQGRNDPAFESAIARYRTELFSAFARRATLVKTMAGALQVQRLGREQHAADTHVFQDELEAIAYLTAR